MSFYRKNRKKVLSIIILLLLGTGTYIAFKFKNSNASASYSEYPVIKKDINVTISGTGVLNSSQEQNVSSKVAGTVTKVYFNEGDKIKAGDVLYEIDNRSVISQIEKLKFSIDQAKSDLDKNLNDVANLTIYAPKSGVISGLTLKTGDSVSRGMEICTIEDMALLKLVVPFNGKQIENFSAGQQAKIYVQDYMRIVQGIVNYVDRTGRIEQKGARVYDVEVLIDNNVANLGIGITASAEIGGSLCLSPSKTEKVDIFKVKAQIGGTVKNLNVRDNEYVYEEQQIIELENDEPEKQMILSRQKLDELNIQLEDLRKDLEECKAIANIDGTIVKLDVAAGDYVKEGASACKISNYDTMQFDISVDELDIAGVKAGMPATVTVGAIPGRKYSGTVVRVATEGSSQGGVATYPVTVVVQNPEQLMGGMNANAEIVIQRKYNVLTVPLIAIQKVGNQNFVIIRKNIDIGESTQTITQRIPRDHTISRIKQYNAAEIEMRRIEVGISDDSDIEVLEGLNEGDVVLVASSNSTNNNRSGQFYMNRGMPNMGGMGGTIRIRESGGMQQSVTVERRSR